MRGTAEQLRNRHPGKWLLIRLDGPETDSGELVAAHEDPAVLDRLVVGGSSEAGGRPLYLTYSIPEGDPLPAFILQRVLPAPVPGEAEIDRGPTSRNVVLLRNVRLGTVADERRVDALLDTGATYCLVPASVAFALGFDEGNRLGRQAMNVVGGRLEMDVHELEYVRAGTAQAYRVSFCVGDLGPTFRFMLLGLSFVEHFMTTLDFDRRRVLFRAREERRIPR